LIFGCTFGSQQTHQTHLVEKYEGDSSSHNCSFEAVSLLLVKKLFFNVAKINLKKKIYIYIYRKVRLMKPAHDSLLLRVSCLRTHRTVFGGEDSCHLVYVRACGGLLLFAWLQWAWVGCLGAWVLSDGLFVEMTVNCSLGRTCFHGGTLRWVRIFCLVVRRAWS